MIDNIIARSRFAYPSSSLCPRPQHFTIAFLVATNSGPTSSQYARFEGLFLRGLASGEWLKAWCNVTAEKPKKPASKQQPTDIRREIIAWFWVGLIFLLINGTIGQARVIPS